MKAIIRLISLLMTAMAALSCMDELADASQEETSSGEKVEMTFSASYADETKTVLVNGTEVWWNPWDAISVNGDPFYVTDAIEPALYAEFAGSTTVSKKYHALYPYNPAWIWENDVTEVYIPINQYASKGRILDDCFISTAVATDEGKNFHFKNQLGYIKFSIDENTGPVQTVMVSANRGEILGGWGTIDFSSDEPVFEMVEIPTAWPITLLSDSILAPGEYYIALYPDTYSGGLTFAFKNPEGLSAIKSIDKEITLEKGVIQNIGLISQLDFDGAPSQREALMDFYNATGGDNWDDNTNWGSDKPVSEWYGVSVDGMGYVTGLEFWGNNLTFDDLPESMANLKKLNTLILLEGDFAKIPDVIRKLEGLQHFAISGGAYTPFVAEIPEWIGDLTNLRSLSLSGEFSTIPDQITALTELEELGICGPWYLGGDLGKRLPDFSKLKNMKRLAIQYFNLGIEIPDWIYDMTSLESLVMNNLKLTGEISEKISNLTNLTNLDFRANELEGEIPEGITSLYNLSYLRLDENNLSGNVPEGFSGLHNLVWLYLNSNRLTGCLPADFEQNPNYESWAVDQNVMLQQNGYGLLPSSEVYVSSDYSKDGEVVVLQEASVGNGVDIVLLGDGFVDRDMNEDGKFDQAIQEAVEYLFSLEPLTSYREYFNVYAVRAVSKHDRFVNGYETALECYLGEPPFVAGNSDKVLEYALKAPIESDDNLTIAVILNVNACAGTTLMGMSDDKAISYVGMARDIYTYYNNSYEAVFIHEVVGHAFAKLGDEYVYQNETYPLSGDLEWRKQAWIDTGYYANLDITSDPEQIRWAHMLKDERYSSYTGIVEGGDYFAYGIWRPEENSMMRNNDPYFNAPSREAIVKRIMKLAGEEYSFEKFAAKDIHNPLPYTRANYVEQPFEPTAPPVIINGSWRDAVKN